MPHTDGDFAAGVPSADIRVQADLPDEDGQGRGHDVLAGKRTATGPGSDFKEAIGQNTWVAVDNMTANTVYRSLIYSVGPVLATGTLLPRFSCPPCSLP